jgi:hypothetical protein
MISLSCPNCARALEFADDLSGIDTACYACYHPLKVPAASACPVRVSEPLPRSFTSPSSFGSGDDSPYRWPPDHASGLAQEPSSNGLTRRRQPQPSSGSVLGAMKTKLLIGVAIVAVGVVGLLLSGGEIWLYVDNGSKEPMVVSVDGKEEATVAPGQHAKIKCEPGPQRIQVHCNQRVLFDEVKDLQKPDRIASNRLYFFNPDKSNRYATYTVKYGSSPLERLFASKQDKESGDPRTVIRAVYKELAAEAKLVPSDSWFEVPHGATVLTRAPKVVTSRSSTERRTFMARVDPKDYAVIRAAQDNKDPSEDDLNALAEAVDRVADSVLP